MLGAFPIPLGLQQVFGCVRPIIFLNPEFPYMSVPGTGYLLEMFGDVFLVTARHVVDNGNFDLQDLRILTNHAKSDSPVIQFLDAHTFTSRDPDDTDHVDVIVARCDRKYLDRSLFTNDHPFDITLRPLVASFAKGMKLHFQGVAPAHDAHTIDDDAQKYCIVYAAGDLIYREPSEDRGIHIADALVHDKCPDFNGMSGSPVFRIENVHARNTSAQFAGMVIRGSREQKVMRFIDAELIWAYLSGFFLNGLSPTQATEKLKTLLETYAHEHGHPFAGWD